MPGWDRDVLGLFGLYGHFSPDLRRSQVARGDPGMDYDGVLELKYEYHVAAIALIRRHRRRRTEES